MRLWQRPRRWWWGTAVLLGAVLVALLARAGIVGGSYDATPRSEPLPAARMDLAEAALRTWLTARASTGSNADLQISALSARVIAQNGAMHPDGTWTAKASVTWAYGSVDPSPASAEVTVALRSSSGSVQVTGLRQPGRVPLWALVSLEVTRTTTTLVATAPGIDHQAYARRAAAAVKVVQRVLPSWRGPLVLEVPASTAQLDQAMGATAGTYANVAAITAAADGSTRADAPVHVLVNPEVMARLDERSAQIVVTHEATHVATDAVLTTNRPLWLSEGFADYVALRDLDVPLATSTSQIAALVRSSGVPTVLPQAADFDATSPHFGAGYEAAWQVCEQIVADAGEQALVRIYDDVGAGKPLATALRSVAGYGVNTLTSRWQQRLLALSR